MNDDPRESTHPGPYVREHVLPPGLTVTEAARRMGVGRPALSNFLNGKAALSPAMAVRLERTFGADRDALLDLQTRFDAREAPAGRRTITAATYAPSVLAVKAREIRDWAGRIESRQELGALVRRLVNSTGRDLSKVDFPAHDDAERRGWDGMVVASIPTPWIPEGESGWELSCNARPRDKANGPNGDFARRTKSVPPRERKACTFVFLTPRDWPGKTAWANEQRRFGLWKDVRAYDASDLEQWIEQSVPVQIWFAERLGQRERVAGYQSLSGFWTRWASAAEPALSPQLFAPAVERHSERFRAWIEESPGRPFTIAADSGDEAVAFLACLMGQENGDNGAGDRGIVFDTPDALHRLASAAPGAFVAVSGNRDVERALSGFYRNIHCVVPRPRNSVDVTGPPADVVLELPGYEDFRNALEAMGIRRGRSERLALESARSPTILRRRLAVMPAGREPDWGRDRETAGKVIPAAMIGAWHAASGADREIVSLLADADYEDLESGVADMLRLDDPPLWSIGQYRGVVSRLDALFATAPFVTAADLDRVFLVAEYVLSETDPALELPESERWMAAVHGKLRDHSNALRRGMGETLILLSEYGGRLFDERLGGDVENRVSDLVRKLLSPLDMQKLLSFDGDLPALAEAAPAGLHGDGRGRPPGRRAGRPRSHEAGRYRNLRRRMFPHRNSLGPGVPGLESGAASEGGGGPCAALLPEVRRQLRQQPPELSHVLVPVLDAGNRSLGRAAHEDAGRTCRASSGNRMVGRTLHGAHPTHLDRRLSQSPTAVAWRSVKRGTTDHVRRGSSMHPGFARHLSELADARRKDARRPCGQSR